MRQLWILALLCLGLCLGSVTKKPIDCHRTVSYRAAYRTLPIKKVKEEMFSEDHQKTMHEVSRMEQTEQVLVGIQGVLDTAAQKFPKLAPVAAMFGQFVGGFTKSIDAKVRKALFKQIDEITKEAEALQDKIAAQEKKTIFYMDNSRLYQAFELPTNRIFNSAMAFLEQSTEGNRKTLQNDCKFTRPPLDLFKMLVDWITRDGLAVKYLEAFNYEIREYELFRDRIMTLATRLVFNVAVCNQMYMCPENVDALLFAQKDACAKALTKGNLGLTQPCGIDSQQDIAIYTENLNTTFDALEKSIKAKFFDHYDYTDLFTNMVTKISSDKVNVDEAFANITQVLKLPCKMVKKMGDENVTIDKCPNFILTLCWYGICGDTRDEKNTKRIWVNVKLGEAHGMFDFLSGIINHYKEPFDAIMNIHKDPVGSVGTLAKHQYSIVKMAKFVENIYQAGAWAVGRVLGLNDEGERRLYYGMIVIRPDTQPLPICMYEFYATEVVGRKERFRAWSDLGYDDKHEYFRGDPEDCLENMLESQKHAGGFFAQAAEFFTKLFSSSEKSIATKLTKFKPARHAVFMCGNNYKRAYDDLCTWLPGAVNRQE